MNFVIRKNFNEEVVEWGYNADRAYVGIIVQKDGQFYFYFTPHSKQKTGYNSAWDGLFYGTLDNAIKAAIERYDEFIFR